MLWVLIRCLRRDWRRHLVALTPDTVVRWHRTGWRRYWRWRSRAGGGRPRLGAAARELSARMSGATPLWGSERVRGELLKLGVAVSNRSVRRSRGRGPHRPPRQTGRPYLRDHAPAIWAADLFAVQTLTFQTPYVLLVITRGRRELVHLSVTAHPTAAGGWRQVAAATAWGQRPTHRIRDRDAVDGRDFRARAPALGIEAVPTPVRSPRANAPAERVIGTLRRDCLDHLIPPDGRHLRAVLAEDADYPNRQRPHRTRGLVPPRPLPGHGARAGPIWSRPVLGGLHRVHERAA